MGWVALALGAGIAWPWAALVATAAALFTCDRAGRANLLLLALISLAGAGRAAVDRMPLSGGIAGWMGAQPRPVTLQGTLLEEPEFATQGRAQQGWLRVESIRAGGQWIPCSGKLQVRLPAEAGLLLSGDRLRLHGLLRLPHLPSSSRFDERRWLWLRGAAGLLSVPGAEAVTRIGRDGRLWFRCRRWVDRFRRRLQGIGRFLLEPRDAGFLEALLLGESRGIPRADWEAFRRTGTVHVLVVSGLHVGLIGGICLLLLTALRLPRTACYLLLAGILSAYCVLTGMNPPIVRSTVGGLLLCWAKVRGIQHCALNLIGAAAVVILAADPRAPGDVSFQLSFAAVSAVVAVDLWLAGRLRPVFLGSLARAGAVSCAAWAATLPILASQFHAVSILTPAANLVVVPWASLLVAGGFLVYGVGGLVPAAAGPFAAAFAWGSQALTQGVRALGAFPGAYWTW